MEEKAHLMVRCPFTQARRKMCDSRSFIDGAHSSHLSNGSGYLELNLLSVALESKLGFIRESYITINRLLDKYEFNVMQAQIQHLSDGYRPLNSGKL